jgi:hypothetical protein
VAMRGAVERGLPRSSRRGGRSAGGAGIVQGAPTAGDGGLASPSGLG